MTFQPIKEEAATPSRCATPHDEASNVPLLTEMDVLFILTYRFRSSLSSAVLQAVDLANQTASWLSDLLSRHRERGEFQKLSLIISGAFERVAKKSGDSRYRYLHACCLIPTFRIHYLGFFALTPPCASLDSTIHVARFHIWQQTFPKSRKQPSSTEQAREMSKRRCSGIRGLGSRHGAGDAEVGKLIE